MSAKLYKIIKPIATPSELQSEIQRAGADFFLEYSEELSENLDLLQTKELKNQYLDSLYNCSFSGQGTKKELRDKVDAAMHIIEAGKMNEALNMIKKQSL